MPRSNAWQTSKVAKILATPTTKPGWSQWPIGYGSSAPPAAPVRTFSSRRQTSWKTKRFGVLNLQNFATPLDFLDPAQHLLDALEICQEKNPQMYQHIVDAMSEEQKQQMTYVQQLAAEAEARKEAERELIREEIAEERAQEAAEAQGHQ